MTQRKRKETHQIYPIIKVEDEVSKGEITKQSLDVPSLIDAFLASQDIRAISKAVYKKGLERFINWMRSNQITEPNKADILRFKVYLIECNLSINTVNLYLVSIKRLFAWLSDMGLYNNIAKGIKGAKQANGLLKESPTIPQVKEMLVQIDISTLPGKRNFAMINLMARTGLRTIEIIRANIEDITQKSGDSLLYVQGKGRDSKDEFVLLTESAFKPILAYLKARGKVDPITPLFVSHSDRNRLDRLTTRTVRAVLKDSFRSIGIDRAKMSAHSLRHFFATQALKAGAPLLQVKDAMRHASIETTQKYLHNLERIDDGAERYIDF